MSVQNTQQKHFHFPEFGDALDAMQAWWDYQDQEGFTRTVFSVSASGRETDLSVSEMSFADQQAVIEFFGQHFAGKFTVHATRQVFKSSD